MENVQSHSQSHKISLVTAILMTINIMVGTGILIGPGKIAQIAGDASFLAWPLVGLLFLPIVLSTAQLTRMLPGSGGFYSYAKEGLNRSAGFISGWLYVVGYSFAAAVEVLALRETLLVSVGNLWFIKNALIFNSVCVASCIALNLLSLKVFSKILNSLTIAKILPLIILIALIPFINPHFTVDYTELTLLPFSLPLAIFGYFGFEYACSISNLIENSEKNASKALLIGFTLTVVIYTLFHFGLINLMGAKNLAAYGAPAFAQFITLPIPYLKSFLSTLIPAASVATLYAGANGMINSNSMLLHAMAEENLFSFSSWLVYFNRYERPWAAIVAQGLTVFVLVMLIPSIWIVGGLCNVGVFMSFVLPFISLIILQHKRQAYHNIPLVVLALCIVTALIIYSASLLGTTMSERLVYTLPLTLPLFGSYFFYRNDNR